MVKRLIILFNCFLFINGSFGQKATLIAEGTTPDLYLIHHVKPKENFYSIGRQYNISPKEISAYNHLQFENGLAIGQAIKIPLSSTNFSQDENAESSESLIPVYHFVQPREGLYRVSIKYNKVPMTTIKKWNHLSSDNVSVGTHLIIGYLKVNPAESTLGRTETDADIASSQGSGEINKTEKKTDPKNTEPVNTTVINHDAQPLPNNDVTTQQTEQSKANTHINTVSSVDFSGGYFKKLFNDQVSQKTLINEDGSAGVFKSTSGWQDGRYYCFSNDAPSGTIIKITYNTTGKSVYAKVLDAIPDIKQNSGLNIVVSNAAAEELGAGEKFVCALSFVK